PATPPAAAPAPVNAVATARPRAGNSQRAGRRRARATTRARGAASERISALLALPPAVMAPRLGATAADRPRAPAPGLIARVVVERPATTLAGADLHAPPAAVHHRLSRVGQQHPEGPVVARVGRRGLAGASRRKA